MWRGIVLQSMVYWHFFALYLSTKYDQKYESRKGHNQLDLEVLSFSPHVEWNRVAQGGVAEA